MVLTVVGVGPVLAEGDGDDDEVYLALGDSLVFGMGASDPATTAYVPLFHQFLVAEEDEDVVLNNLGVPGETSTSFINVGQLAAALAQI